MPRVERGGEGWRADAHQARMRQNAWNARFIVPPPPRLAGSPRCRRKWESDVAEVENGMRWRGCGKVYVVSIIYPSVWANYLSSEIRLSHLILPCYLGPRRGVTCPHRCLNLTSGLPVPSYPVTLNLSVKRVSVLVENWCYCDLCIYVFVDLFCLVVIYIFGLFCYAFYILLFISFFTYE